MQNFKKKNPKKKGYLISVMCYVLSWTLQIQNKRHFKASKGKEFTIQQEIQPKNGLWQSDDYALMDK